MDALRVCLFGFPQVALHGKTVLPARRKVLALLVYLLSNGEAHSRESLATLFWPEQDNQQASAYLRNALWEIRRLVGEDWLELEGKTVRFRLEKGAWVDVHHFTKSIANPDVGIQGLQEAVDLYRADFLTGFTLPDALDFDDWQTAQAEALRRMYDLALAKLAQAYSQGQELDAAVSAARRRVDLDPLNEAAQRVLIELLSLCGQRSAAVHQYEACQRVLDKELGVTPEPETVALYHRVSAGEMAPSAKVEIPQAARPAPTSSLPVLTVPLVGRAGELEQLARMLADPGCRLLTISGPGGAGKTSLALEAAHSQAALFPDGAWFVPLAPAKSPDAILPAMAEAIHIPLQGIGKISAPESLLSHLIEYLSDKKLLLLLDNLEHLLGSDLPFQELLEGTASIKILATSRERLNLPGEWVLEIGGLPVPGFHSSGHAADYEAAQLFIAAARRANASFTPSSEDWAAIERICQQVDGLPLGLELAAAWVRVLPCPEIASEMERTLDFLYTSQRGVSERQHSLRAAFDYSWALLSESEKAALRRLTIFQGGFNRQAAAQVAAVPLSMLTSLIDKSLLRREDEGRFNLHASIKQFAHEQLSQNRSDLLQLQRWHSSYFLNLLSDWYEDLKGRRQMQALAAFAREQNNLFAAWSWAIETQDAEAIKQNVIAVGLALIMRGQRDEGILFFDPVIKMARLSGEKTLLAFCLAVLRYFWEFQELHTEKMEDECLELIAQIDDSSHKAYSEIMSCVGPGNITRQQKIEFARHSAAYLHAHGDDWGAGLATLVLGDTFCINLARYDEAEEEYQSSLAFFTSQGNDWGRALNLNGLAFARMARGQYSQARRFVEECLAIYEQLNDPYRITQSKLFLADILEKTGKLEEARRCLESNLPMLERLSWKGYLALYRQAMQKIKV